MLYIEAMKTNKNFAVLAFLALIVSAGSAIGQYLESATFLSNTPASLLSGFYNGAQYNVDAYKIRYYTTDVDGSQTIASGALLVPKNTACDSLPLAVYDHGTVLEREAVPSRDNIEATVAKVIASTGAIAVAPDYLGLGDNQGLHPYLHGETQATATIDMMRAAREYLRDSLQIDLNGEVFVSGYSQGGHAAMATVKYIQDNSLQGEFNLLGAGPASGPYNLSSTMLPLLLSNAPYSNPGYVVYLLFAMERVYGNIYNSYSDILDIPYDTLVPPLFDGTYDMNAVNAVLPNQIRDFMQDTVLDNLEADTITFSHPIRQALMANDNYDWNPSFPMELYYCTQDEQVAFQNSLDAEAAMQANGASVTAIDKGAFNHGGCFLPALRGALDYFILLRQSCSGVGLDEMGDKMVEVYPQPAQNQVRLKGLESEPIKVFNLNGQLVYEGWLDDSGKLELEGWPVGVYFLKSEHRGDMPAVKIMVAR
jgi:hypothetical protein